MNTNDSRGHSVISWSNLCHQFTRIKDLALALISLDTTYGTAGRSPGSAVWWQSEVSVAPWFSVSGSRLWWWNAWGHSPETEQSLLKGLHLKHLTPAEQRAMVLCTPELHYVSTELLVTPDTVDPELHYVSNCIMYALEIQDQLPCWLAGCGKKCR